MKKYELIKEYPGCKLQVFDIVEWDKSLDIPQYRCKSKSVGVNGVDVSKYPEFWKEIIEKNYQVVTINWDGDLYNISEERASSKYDFQFKYKNENGGWMNLYSGKNVINPSIKIHSVKRLSDNKIFTVGDIVARNKSWETGSRCYITKFYIDNNLLRFSIKQGDSTGNYPFDDITYTYNIKLIISKDGVDIYEGDEIWGININSWDVFSNKAIKDISLQKWQYGIFSTKEAAESYVLLNKPCLSINDINTIIPKLSDRLSANLVDYVLTNKK